MAGPILRVAGWILVFALALLWTAHCREIPESHYSWRWLNDLADLAAPETPVKFADGLVKSLSDPALREDAILDPDAWFLAPSAEEPFGSGCCTTDWSEQDAIPAYAWLLEHDSRVADQGVRRFFEHVLSHGWSPAVHAALRALDSETAPSWAALMVNMGTIYGLWSAYAREGIAAEQRGLTTRRAAVREQRLIMDGLIRKETLEEFEPDSWHLDRRLATWVAHRRLAKSSEQ